MQSFIVEDQSKSMTQINFDIAHIGATGKNGNAGLRAAAPTNDLLEIIASTPQSAVRAVVASREDGSPTFNRKDASKFFAGINSLPDIYLLKPSADTGTIAVGADVVNKITGDLVIPLGISTTYEGSITLSFAGMDTYDARIFLVDNAASNNKEIELTGKASYDYTFDYIPGMADGTAVSNENRFLIRISPTNATGIESEASSNTLVYSDKPGTIQTVSSALIRQITVFDIRGMKIYDNASVNAGEYTVPDLATGVYIVKVISENEVKTAKVIVR
jgi:hypothetical protein